MNMTLYTLFAAWEVHEHQQRAAWERARFTAYWSVLPHVKANTLQSMTDLIVFEWERERIEAEKKAEKARLSAAFAKIKNNPSKWLPEPDSTTLN